MPAGIEDISETQAADLVQEMSSEQAAAILEELPVTKTWLMSWEKWMTLPVKFYGPGRCQRGKIVS